MGARQNLAISLTPDVLRKAKVLAARRNTSVTRLLSDLVQQLAGEEERYEAARRTALGYLETGFFPMGGQVTAAREEWHER